MSIIKLLHSCQKYILFSFFILLSHIFSINAYAERLPEFLSKVPPSEIFPGATSYGKPEGNPLVARIFQEDKPVGFAYITTDLVNTRGYSSKPIDMMIGIADDGTIKGAKLVEHHEPIVLIGIPEEKVNVFIQHYIGLNFVKNPPQTGKAPADIISGATVTLMVINDSIQRSVKRLTQQYKLGSADVALSSSSATVTTQETTEKRVINEDKQDILTWDELLAQKAVQELYLSVADVNRLFEEFGGADAAKVPEKGPDTDTFIRLYAAVVDQPSIGQSLLGKMGWENLKKRLKPGQHAMVIMGDGRYSFKGSGYVRGGIFDRIEVIQNETSFRFIDLNHERLPSLSAKGAPRYKEIGIFVSPEDVNFNPAEPWRLQLMIQRTLNVNDKAFVTSDLHYTLPDEFVKVEKSATPPVIEQPAQAVAQVEQQQAQITEEATEEAKPLWQMIWEEKLGQIIVISIALIILIAVFFFQNTLTSYPVFYKRFRTIFLLFSVVYIGWYAQAQLSVVNVFTFTDSLRTGFSWEYFLMDPLVFIMWSATAISILFWNRGAFCGWLCPFGSLQELLNQLARKIGIKQIKVPYTVQTRLAALKYVIFMGLFGVSLYSLGLAEKLAEVEPFKTAIILKFVREWWFVLFAVTLLVLGLFIERFYCRYLCPLGAALAIPAKLRVFDWLRRYKMCGDPCQRCANDCPVQAIHPTGEIDANECIQCLNCQMLYHHQTKCPHLVQKNKVRNKMADAKAAAEEKKVTLVKKEDLGLLK
ncbi:regulatory protein NosR [Pelistega sp. NLN82]|uniref:Regulatory protein NosR n=1 Tax=Pelistega ratti TaxID=2652177 RepID=A0A6L9Y7R8_9BURK|nr:NosR/NirI family protein [Pelistega ratti]NEN76235.1 regulatory protein NosR [Pelistega ratti]